MLLVIFITLFLYTYGEYMLRDVMYTIKSTGETYQLKSSSYRTGNTIKFVTRVSTQDQYTILLVNLNTGENFTTNAKQDFAISYTEFSSFFSNNCVYNFTIMKASDYPTITIYYTEFFPTKYDILSDNEEYSVATSTNGDLFFKYHTPSNIINKVHRVFFQIYNAYPSGFNGAYFSTTQFPDTNDMKTYSWSITDKYDTSLTIDENDPNFCKDSLCVYYITIRASIVGYFSILPNCSFDYFDVKLDRSEEIADVPPMSSSYGRIHLPKGSTEYYNLVIWISYTNYQELEDELTNVAIFVSLEPIINPSTTIWYSHTSSGKFGDLQISNNDPSFCSECYYYFRLDGVPDVNFLIDSSVYAYTTDTLYPMFLTPLSTYRGFLRGNSQDQKVHYQLFVPQESPDSLIDTIVFTLNQDVFVEEGITAELSNDFKGFENPDCQQKYHWYFNFGGEQSLTRYITRSQFGFCTKAYYILSIKMDNCSDRQQNFNVKAFYNYNVKELDNNKTREDIVLFRTEGIFYYYNSSKIDLDTSFIITLVNQCTDSLIAKISISPFRDGDASYEWSLIVGQFATGSYRIDNQDPFYQLTQDYYLNVDLDQSWSYGNCSFTINMVFEEPRIYILNPISDPITRSFSNNRDTYIYSSINVNYIRNLQSVKFILSYTGISSPAIIYMQNHKLPRPDLYDYISQSWIYYTPFNFEIDKGMIGFCENCTYYFAVYIPLFFKGTYSLSTELVTLPVELKYNEQYDDVCEPESGADYYTIQLAKNARNPKIIMYLDKELIWTSELYLAVSTDKSIQRPNKSHCNWYNETFYTGGVSIIIDTLNPKYCTECTYYIAVGPSKITANTIPYQVKITCPDGGCTTCPPHFTIESNCTECESGFYGSQCSQCPCSSHGTCNDGRTGDGKCTCSAGWSGDYCLDCQSGYYGYNCDKCTVDCHANGICDDGIRGSGQCNCYQKQYSSESGCSDCRYGYYDHDCSDICPGLPNNPICSGHGVCNSGKTGNGHCKCDTLFTGIDCATPSYQSSCTLECDVDHGSCDERNGICVCYDQYTGYQCQTPPITPTPSPKPSKVMNGGVIAVIVILVLVFIGGLVGLFFLLKKKKLLSLFSKRAPARFQPISGGGGNYQMLE